MLASNQLDIFLTVNVNLKTTDLVQAQYNNFIIAQFIKGF